MKYKAFAKDKNGIKRLIEAESIVFELEGETIEVDLTIPPKQWSGLTLSTPEYTPNREVGGSVFSIRPGAANVITLSVFKPKPDDI